MRPAKQSSLLAPAECRCPCGFWVGGPGAAELQVVCAAGKTWPLWQNRIAGVATAFYDLALPVRVIFCVCVGQVNS